MISFKTLSFRLTVPMCKLWMHNGTASGSTRFMHLIYV